MLGPLDSWVVLHSALNIDTLHHALGHEFKPQWQQTLFWIQAQHLHFNHDSIWFIWFDNIICVLNLSWELWNRRKWFFFNFFSSECIYYFPSDLAKSYQSKFWSSIDDEVHFRSRLRFRSENIFDFNKLHFLLNRSEGQGGECGTVVVASNSRDLQFKSRP